MRCTGIVTITAAKLPLNLLPKPLGFFQPFFNRGMEVGKWSLLVLGERNGFRVQPLRAWPPVFHRPHSDVLPLDSNDGSFHNVHRVGRAGGTQKTVPPTWSCCCH